MVLVRNGKKVFDLFSQKTLVKPFNKLLLIPGNCADNLELGVFPVSEVGPVPFVTPL